MSCTHLLHTPDNHKLSISSTGYSFLHLSVFMPLYCCELMIFGRQNKKMTDIARSSCFHFPLNDLENGTQLYEDNTSSSDVKHHTVCLQCRRVTLFSTKKLLHFETNHQLHKQDQIVEPFCCKSLNMGVGAPSLFLDKYTQF